MRDIIMGKTPHDYDITTSALPETVQGLFEKTVPTGIKHGTVTVIIDKTPIEVTTFRTDGNYKDSRHPANVNFVSSVKEDLSRRDFTVNAIAYNSSKGIVDYFGGMHDIKSSCLRAVGNPEERFCEDALRILRLFRFASVLNFSCEKNTLNAAVEYSHLLEKISRERIFSEIYKSVSGENFKVFESLISCGGLRFLKIIKAPDYNIIKNTESNELALFSFLYFSSSDITETLNLLNTSNRLKSYCRNLSELTAKEIPKTKSELKTMLCDYPPEQISDFLKLKNLLTREDTFTALKLLNEILENNEPYLIRHLKISGEDLKALGISGNKIGSALKQLQTAVINHPEKNIKEKLIKEILP